MLIPPSPQDAVSVPALRDLIYAFGEMFLGGNFKTMHSHIGVVTDNMVMGTSAKVVCVCVCVCVSLCCHRQHVHEYQRQGVYNYYSYYNHTHKRQKKTQ
jgi:hypothetical protein